MLEVRADLDALGRDGAGIVFSSPSRGGGRASTRARRRARGRSIDVFVIAASGQWKQGREGQWFEASSWRLSSDVTSWLLARVDRDGLGSGVDAEEDVPLAAAAAELNPAGHLAREQPAADASMLVIESAAVWRGLALVGHIGGPKRKSRKGTTGPIPGSKAAGR